MTMFFYNLLKDFGVQVAGVSVICYLLWKIMTNHLAHIAIDIKSIISQVAKIDEKLDRTVERVSVLEGMSKRRTIKKSSK